MDALIERQQALLAAMDTKGVDEDAVLKALDEVEEAICDALADEVEAGRASAASVERMLNKLGIAWD